MLYAPRMGLGQLFLTALAAFVAGLVGVAALGAAIAGGAPQLDTNVVVPLMLAGFFVPAIGVAMFVGNRFSPAPPAPPAPPAAPARDPGDTEPLDALRAELSVTRPGAGSGAIAALLLVIFVLQGLSDGSVQSLAVLIGVLLLHEGGHALGMLGFGFRDVRMFFLPFIGAAVTGRKEDAPAWQHAVVLLLGPVPGVLLGAVLVVASRGVGLAGEIGRMAVYLNVFNLLPFEPLDGGRLLGVTLFSRSRWLEAAFSVLGALAIAALALRLSTWPLGVVAGLTLVAVPRRLRFAAAVQRVKDRGLPLGPRVEALPPETLGALDDEGRKLSPRTWVNLPARATLVRELHGRLQLPPPRLLGTLAVLGAYGVSLLLSAVAVLLAVYFHVPHAKPGGARPVPAAVQVR